MAASENSANTSIIISLESIQQQIQHCENIVDNIDKLVPNLYKIRQQALAQKGYITDIQHTLSNNNKQYKSVTDKTDKIYAKIEGTLEGLGLPDDNKPSVLVVSAPSTNVYDTSGNGTIGTATTYKNKENVAITKNIINNAESLRKVVQSLYKFKHDQGTSVHFTTQQIDGSANGDIRTKGLNLSDVESITEGLNDYLSISDKEVAGASNSAVETKIQNCVLKLFAPVHNTTAASLSTSNIETSDAAVDTTTATVDVFKAPISSNTGTSTYEITVDRDIKAKRTNFSANGPGPTAIDFQSMLTFGLN